MSAVIFLLTSFYEQTDAQEFVGNYIRHTVSGDTVFFFCENSTTVILELCTEDIVRLSLFPPPGSVRFDSSFVVVQTFATAVPFSVEDKATNITITTSKLSIVCQKQPFRIAFYSSSRQLLVKEHDSVGLGWDGDSRYAYFEQATDEHFYGFGELCQPFPDIKETYPPLDRKGYNFYIENNHNGGIGGNLNIPFFCSTKGYGLYFDNTYPGYFDMGTSDPSTYYYRVKKGVMNYYFIYGPDLKSILEKYTWLTGRQPLPPRWTLGYLQSKYGYRDESEARSIVTTMRQRGIPCDAIILDLYWYGSPSLMGNMWWDFSRWQNPKQMMSDFRSLGIKTILIEEPYINRSSSNFAFADAQHFLGTDSSGNTIVVNAWMGQAGLLDMTNPAAQSWWWGKHLMLIDQGVAGWWTDLGEPEVHPSGMMHYAGERDKVHNIFNLVWAKTLFDGYQSYRPDERIVNITRSGFAGMQRYGCIPWSGDVRKAFRPFGLEVQPLLMLGMGLSGVAYLASDIGGFAGGTTTPELYARWMEYGTFCPITRPHSAGQSAEPWAFGAEVEAICRKYIQLRYRILPYIYTYAYRNHQTGVPIARPLLLEYPNDSQVTNLSSEYLWGESFLVAPVTTEGATSRSVYLPQGRWTDYWTGKKYEGNQTITVDAPLEVLPLFVKDGSIIPMQNVMNYLNEYPLDTLTLDIYPSGPDVPGSGFTMYEDDGLTKAYLTGAYALTLFTCQTTEQFLKVGIGKSEGNYTGKPNHRIYLAQIHHVRFPPDSVTLSAFYEIPPEAGKNGGKMQFHTSWSSLVLAEEGWCYDETRQMLLVKCQTQPDSAYQIKAFGKNLISAVRRVKDQPIGSYLEQNYPNPFNLQTMVSYKLQVPSFVSLRVYDILGQEVVTLAEGYQPAGLYKVEWKGQNNSGQQVGSGVYLYRLSLGSVTGQAGDFADAKRMSLLR